MKINEYFKLLLEGKEQEAEKIRISTIPNKLIKFRLNRYIGDMLIYSTLMMSI